MLRCLECAAFAARARHEREDVAAQIAPATLTPITLSRFPSACACDRDAGLGLPREPGTTARTYFPCFCLECAVCMPGSACAVRPAAARGWREC